MENYVLDLIIVEQYFNDDLFNYNLYIKEIDEADISALEFTVERKI
jgi:hypothetical protein